MEQTQKQKMLAGQLYHASDWRRRHYSARRYDS